MDGYEFWFHKMLSNDIKRRTCTKSSYQCYLKLNSNNEIADSRANHNHDKFEESIIRRQVLSNCLKTKAVENGFAKS